MKTTYKDYSPINGLEVTFPNNDTKQFTMAGSMGNWQGYSYLKHYINAYKLIYFINIHIRKFSLYQIADDKHFDKNVLLKARLIKAISSMVMQ